MMTVSDLKEHLSDWWYEGILLISPVFNYVIGQK